MDRNRLVAKPHLSINFSIISERRNGMKFFEEPIIEVMRFEVQDVVTASGEPEPSMPALMPPCA